MTSNSNPLGALLGAIILGWLTAEAQCIQCRERVAVYNNNWDHDCDNPGPTLLDLIKESRQKGH